MSLILDLQPEIEHSLLAQAQARGISLSDFAIEVLVHAARPLQANSDDAPEPKAGNLYELFAPIRGLLTDDEIDRYFTRTPSTSRPVDFGD